ncbi:MAG TPA: nuclear transport factor 2 family protein [Mycobacterium sp.]|nr:nuclear transport factor 2 family protein [Mycobacterium sp.]
MNGTESLDAVEIQQLLARYARAVDTKDWDLYRSVFTDDAHIDYTSAGILAGSRDDVADFLAQAFTGIPWSMHYITNIEAEIDGDTARVRAMFYNPMFFPGVSGPSFFGGYYHHDLVRTPDGWRSRNLREETIWSTNSAMETQR